MDFVFVLRSLYSICSTQGQFHRSQESAIRGRHWIQQYYQAWPYGESPEYLRCLIKLNISAAGNESLDQSERVSSSARMPCSDGDTASRET